MKTHVWAIYEDDIMLGFEVTRDRAREVKKPNQVIRKLHVVDYPKNLLDIWDSAKFAHWIKYQGEWCIEVPRDLPFSRKVLVKRNNGSISKEELLIKVATTRTSYIYTFLTKKPRVPNKPVQRKIRGYIGHIPVEVTAPARNKTSRAQGAMHPEDMGGAHGHSDDLDNYLDNCW